MQIAPCIFPVHTDVGCLLPQAPLPTFSADHHPGTTLTDDETAAVNLALCGGGQPLCVQTYSPARSVVGYRVVPVEKSGPSRLLIAMDTSGSSERALIAAAAPASTPSPAPGRDRMPSSSPSVRNVFSAGLQKVQRSLTYEDVEQGQGMKPPGDDDGEQAADLRMSMTAAVKEAVSAVSKLQNMEIIFAERLGSAKEKGKNLILDELEQGVVQIMEKLDARSADEDFSCEFTTSASCSFFLPLLSVVAVPGVARGRERYSSEVRRICQRPFPPG